ncbi:aminomethyl-transferring glycine dehydrogenase subunit GcvPA [Arthrobacter psychrolactophilus]
MQNSTVHPYIPNTVPSVIEEMLAVAGATSIEDFYEDVPATLRVKGLLNLPEPFLAEADLEEHVSSLLNKNRSTREVLSFLGAGVYNHYVPSVVDEVINRSEFLTAYAGEPYEDHGRFQALFEYTSMMAEMLNMDVVNVPTYDGMQATATALAMAGRITGRSKVIVASEVNPDLLSKVNDYLLSHTELVFVPTRNGAVDTDALAGLIDAATAAVWVQTPSYHGVLESAGQRIADLAHAAGALLVVGTDPITYGAITPPADWGADIVCGEIQSLGIHQWFGGGRGGFIAVHDDPKFIMEMPSRLFGLASTSVEGEYGFGDVAWDRTSFALREEGKEWVGTAAALWGIAAGVYLASMGPVGIAELGETVLARTAYAQAALSRIDGVKLSDSAAHFREFAIDLAATGKTAAQVVTALRARDIEPGVVVGEHLLLVCVTERITTAHIDTLASALTDFLKEN